MKFKKFLFFALTFAMALSLVTFCSSDDDDDSSSSDSSSNSGSSDALSGTITLSLAVSDVTYNSAVVVVSYSGETPYTSRVTSAIAYDDFVAAVDVTDASALATYFQSNGSAATLPYTVTLTGLSPVETYIVGAVCYDSTPAVADAAYIEFTTAEPTNAIGDTGGAGYLDDIIY